MKDSQNMKNEVRLEIKLTESNGSCLDVSNKCEKMKDESAGKVLTAECVSEEASKNHAEIEVAMSEKVNHQNLTKTDSSPVRGAVSGFLVESNDAGRCLANNEVCPSCLRSVFSRPNDIYLFRLCLLFDGVN